MKFSIITICKNASESIRQTIDSVLGQRYKEYEYIIVDGASDDGTVDLLNSYMDAKMKIISEPDRGISDAFNKGIRMSSGDVLFFLNSGDYFVSSSVLGMVEADIACCDADIYAYSVTSMLSSKWPESEKAGNMQWEKALIPHQGTFIKRAVFSEVGMFNINFKIRMDYDFFCRCYKAGKRFHCNPVVITHYDTNGISSTDTYSFEREGLSVRLLYNSNVESGEKDVLDFLIGDKGDGQSEHLEKIRSQRRLIEKDHKIMEAMYKWLRLANGGWSPDEYFIRHHCHNVAIYGFGMLGKILYEELLRKQIAVSYIIDQNEEIEEVNVISWEDEWNPVDCIVITPFHAYKKIKDRIKREKGDYKTVSLENILID